MSQNLVPKGAKKAPENKPLRGRVIGYARVSTDDQTVRMQVDDLTAHGCDEIVEETGSGAKTDRPRLGALLRKLKAGDTLVVWRLDRLGRSLAHLIATVGELENRGVHFASLKDSIDTSSAGGRLVFHILASLAEFERALIRERVTAGLEAARAAGVQLGRRAVLTAEKCAEIQALIDGGASMSQAAALASVGRTTLYRAIWAGLVARAPR